MSASQLNFEQDQRMLFFSKYDDIYLFTMYTLNEIHGWQNPQITIRKLMGALSIPTVYNHPKLRICHERNFSAYLIFSNTQISTVSAKQIKR